MTAESLGDPAVRPIKRREEFNLPNQVGPAKLNKHARLTLVLPIRRIKITADTTKKIIAERVIQHFAAARRINLEKSKKLCNETPKPIVTCRSS